MRRNTDRASLTAVSIACVALSWFIWNPAQAAKEWAPQEADAILAQAYAQLLVRPVAAEANGSLKTASGVLSPPPRTNYAAQLVSGEKSVRQIVESIALSQEFRQRWITPHMGGELFGATPGLPPVAAPEKAIDNLYCALLGRRVDPSALAAARKEMVRSGIERVILSLIEGTEYQQQFGDTQVPRPSRNGQGAADCPQVVAK